MSSTIYDLRIFATSICLILAICSGALRITSKTQGRQFARPIACRLELFILTITFNSFILIIPLTFYEVDF